MCGSDDCDNDEIDRRAFLTGATTAIAGMTISQASAAIPQSKQPETRVLDDPKVQHGRVIFKQNVKTPSTDTWQDPKLKAGIPLC